MSNTGKTRCRGKPHLSNSGLETSDLFPDIQILLLHLLVTLVETIDLSRDLIEALVYLFSERLRGLKLFLEQQSLRVHFLTGDVHAPSFIKSRQERSVERLLQIDSSPN